MNNPGLIEQLQQYDTALIANTIGYISQEPPESWYIGGTIRSQTPALGPTVGYAVTCEVDSSSPDTGEGDMEGYWRQLDAMTAMQAPSVWVVRAVGSRPDHECVLGDGMAKTLRAAGCIAVVTDGGVRDLPGLMTVPFAAYARGVTIHHCRMRVRRVDVPVEVGGITVRPGDLIHAGAEGVIRVPPDCLDRLVATADANFAFEHEAHAMLRRTDLSTRDKRRRLEAMIASHGLTDCVTAAAPPAVSRA